MAAPATFAPPAEEFPRLRAAVTLTDGGFDRSGAPGVVVHDPVRHRFFRLPRGMADILRANGQGGDPQEVAELAQFLIRQRLAEGAPAAGLQAERKAGAHGLVMQALHSYLSFRIPLVNPEPILDALLPWARMLATRTVLVALVAGGLLGLYFAGRQWDHFLATFVDFFNPRGALLYGVTLVGLKVFHELGHGFVARHFGCRVPVMGINFLVLTPMLYTEASDAWRLSSRRRRFLIGAAGVLTEMALASVALLLWAFLPDGALRSAAYFVAATAWVMSLSVNLSPFMRFDGYHMLVDLTGLHNIGPRAFALATWGLRETLFKTGEAMPEFHPPGRRRALVALAWGTWIYRVVVFGGIALLVYHMFPKAVGLPLAAIEIHWFIVKPVLRELALWKGMGMSHLLSTARAKTSLAILGGFLLLAAMPLDRHVAVPAVLTPAREMRLHVPEAAQVRMLGAAPGARVKAGDVLAIMEAPEIAHQRKLADLRLAMTESKLARLAADASDRAQSQVLRQERAAAEDELRGLAARAERLVMRAPFDGVVADRLENVAVGQWVSADQMLFHVIDPAAAVLNGFVPERESARLSSGAAVRFVGDDGMADAVAGHLRVIGNPGGAGPALAYLAARHGGPISTVASGAGGGDVPLQGHLPVVMAADGAAPERAVRGMAVVAAEPQSLLGFAFGRIVTVVLRESGF